MSEFEVGDKVKIIRTPYAFEMVGFEVGAAGTVVWVRDHGVAVQPDNEAAEQAELFFYNGEVQKIEEETNASAEYEPQVGDRVRLEGSRYAVFQDGMTGTLIDSGTTYERYPYAIEFDTGGSEIFKRDEFVVLHAEPEPEPEPEDYDMTPNEARELMSDGAPQNTSYEADETDKARALRAEALFAAIQSFAGTGLATTGPAIVQRAEKFLKFLEGKDD